MHPTLGEIDNDGEPTSLHAPPPEPAFDARGWRVAAAEDETVISGPEPVHYPPGIRQTARKLVAAALRRLADRFDG